MADRAPVHVLLDRAEALLERRLRVDLVQVEEPDRVGAQGAQALLDLRADDLRPALARAAVAALGGDEHVLGDARQCLPDRPLALALAVQVRGVDVAHAGGHGLADERHVLGCGREAVGAEADAGHLDACELKVVTRFQATRALAYGTQRSASGVTCSSCVAARPPCSPSRRTACAISCGSASAATSAPLARAAQRLDAGVDDQQRDLDPVLAQLEGRRLRERADAERARRPEPAAGHRPPRRAARDLHDRGGPALLEQEPARRRQERERGTRRRRGPGVEGVRAGLGERAPAERSRALAAVRRGGVDDEVGRAVRGRALLQRRVTLARSVTSARIASAPSASTPSSVASERATPAAFQPASRSVSMIALPRLRAPNTSALRAASAIPEPYRPAVGAPVIRALRRAGAACAVAAGGRRRWRRRAAPRRLPARRP